MAGRLSSSSQLRTSVPKPLLGVSRPIGHAFEQVRQIGEAITNLVEGYGLKTCPEFEVISFAMHFDTNEPTLGKPVPTPFAVERRVGSPYEENKFLPQAPLKTSDHKAVLERLRRFSWHDASRQSCSVGRQRQCGAPPIRLRHPPPTSRRFKSIPRTSRRLSADSDPRRTRPRRCTGKRTPPRTLRACRDG